MAGLLEIIARRLLGVGEPKKTDRATVQTVHRTTYTSNEAISGENVKLKSTDVPSADAWVKNSTISDIGNTTFDRTIKRERTHRDVEREDYLLTQIDEFREKAQQLQDLLLSKESKVQELQNIVDEREGKAKELESILKERQRKADGITEEMTKQIDNLIGKVSAKMDEIGTSISATVEKDLKDGKQLSEQQLEELKELKELLATITPQLETVKSELSEKVHSENVKCYRNISDLFKSMEDKLDKVNDVEQKVLSVRKCTIAIIVLSIINMLGLSALALYELGIFQLLLG